MIFPTVFGSNLSGQEYTVPYGLEGEFNVLLVAFEPSHQFQLQSWMPSLERLHDQYPRLWYYQLPTLWSYGDEQRSMIDAGMRRAITDPDAREIVITLYLDKTVFADLLGFTSEDVIYVLLVDREGEILWRTEGMCTVAKRDELEQTLHEIFAVDDATS
jgi:hypothetical protein